MSPVPSNPDRPGNYHSAAASAGAAPLAAADADCDRTGGFFGRWGGRLGWIAFVIALVVIWRLENNYQSYFQTNPNLEERVPVRFCDRDR